MYKTFVYHLFVYEIYHKLIRLFSLNYYYIYDDALFNSSYITKKYESILTARLNQTVFLSDINFYSWLFSNNSDFNLLSLSTSTFTCFMCPILVAKYIMGLYILPGKRFRTDHML